MGEIYIMNYMILNAKILKERVSEYFVMLL